MLIGRLLGRCRGHDASSASCSARSATRELRVLFSGYAAANYKLFVFVVSAVICGVGGALYVPQVGIINPSEMSPENPSRRVWVRRRRTRHARRPDHRRRKRQRAQELGDPAVPGFWLIILGGLFILVVLLPAEGRRSEPARAPSCAGRWRQTHEAASAKPQASAGARCRSHENHTGRARLRPHGRLGVNIRSASPASRPSTTSTSSSSAASCAPSSGRTARARRRSSTSSPAAPSRHGQIEFGQTTDLTRLNEYEIYRLGIGRKFQTPTVLPITPCGRTSAPEGSTIAVRGSSSATPTAERDRMDEILKRINLGRSATEAPARSRTAKSSGSRSACCSRKTAAPPRRRTRRRHDRRRNARPANCSSPSPASTHRRHRARHGLRPQDRRRKVTVLHQGSVLCEGRSRSAGEPNASIEVYLGRKTAAAERFTIRQLEPPSAAAASCAASNSRCRPARSSASWAATASARPPRSAASPAC